jgi:hypothetical protein
MRIHRWRILALVVLLALGAAAALWQMSRVPPAWYRPPPRHDPKVAEFANQVEYRLVQEAQKIREPDHDVWTLRVREEQINAWLATRLQAWLEHEGQRWPDQLGTPQTSIGREAISLALPLIGAARTRYVTAKITPVIENGELRLELHRVALGRVSLPGEPLANLLAAIADAAPQAMELSHVNTAVDWLRRREGIDPVIELADDRRLRILDLQLDDGWIDITAQTLDEAAE